MFSLMSLLSQYFPAESSLSTVSFDGVMDLVVEAAFLRLTSVADIVATARQAEANEAIIKQVSELQSIVHPVDHLELR